LRLQERRKVGKQRAIDDLDAGTEGVDVVSEQSQIGGETSAVASKVKPFASSNRADSARLSTK